MMTGASNPAHASPHMQTLELPGPGGGLRVPIEMHHVGMVAFLVSEVAFFSTLVTTYIYFLTVPQPPPHPRDALSLPVTIVDTVFLLTSSFTIHRAEKNRHRGRDGRFLMWWAATILLGALFLGGTAIEWRDLIHDHGLTIDRNLFGSCYYTLVGFHALHVTIGVVVLSTVWVLTASSLLRGPAPLAVTFAGWYWHFVDVVWVVVFCTVYVFGR